MEPPSAVRERRDQRPYAEHHAVDVDPDRPPVGIVGEVDDVGLTGHDPGIEMGQVDAAVAVGDRGDDPGPRRRVTDIGLQGQAPHLVGGPLRRCPVEVDDGHRRSGLGQAGGRGQPDSRSTAGDHGHLACELSHRVPLASVSGCRADPAVIPDLTLPGHWGILGGRSDALPVRRTLNGRTLVDVVRSGARGSGAC